jgi:putative DNA methylase
MTNDKRLIEDYLPIEAIGEAASSEPRTKGHISTLHVWRARRPLVACRAAVYGALVLADRWVKEIEPKNPPADQEKAEAYKNGAKRGLNRRAAADFVTKLCKYPGDAKAIAQAQQHILEAHAERLTEERRETVSVTDIESGQAPRPKVLDMFAGGGAIPLEAARLGCESHAVELNPVAYLIELCTVTFPQRFGEDLADDVERWGKLVLERTKQVVTDVIAQIPRLRNKPRAAPPRLPGHDDTASNSDDLSVVAYYWTRTVPCPNPQCRGTVPLYRQTWLRKKSSGYVALKAIANKRRKTVSFEVVGGATEGELGFDPSAGSEGSSTVCPFCQTSVEGAYVRQHGDEMGFGQQLMCVIALNPDESGKLYIVDESLAHGEAERQALAECRAAELERELGSSSLDEEIPPTGNAGLATGNSYLYGIRTFRQAFTPRQRFILLSMAREVRRAHQEMLDQGMELDRAKAITTFLGMWISRLTDRCNGLARWDNTGEKIQSLTTMKRFAMTWDFPEVNIFGGASGDAWGNLQYITAVIRQEGAFRNPVQAERGSATELTFSDSFFDAVITDPPYYDNESYSELSDVCYVWLRPTIGFLYPEHFAASLTPKKKECVAAAYRQGGKSAARKFYEGCLFRSLQEAHRVSKPGGVLVIVYAHKTTLGWATLVDALRMAGFTVTEAWPLDTETKARVAHHGDAALASSIFLTGRKRATEAGSGNYEDDVQPELAQIVRERVETLWELGISGADLVIACVGAGLRAFTRFARVEYANGEEVPAKNFLAEVETVVLDTILTRLSKEVGGNGGRHSLAGVDPATRFYILWRYTYKNAELDAGEAIVFANGTHVELDGPSGLSSGARALIEKKKAKYRLRDFTERGDNDKLGLPDEGQAGKPVSLIDSLHRTLWLMEHMPRSLAEFLREAEPNRDQMRLVAQALAGPALKGSELADVSPSAEQSALAKLTANWRSVIEDNVFSPSEQADRKRGQGQLFRNE